MMLKKPSEIDLELDRLQAELDRCGRDRQAHEARVQAIKEKMTAARVKGLIEEKVFQHWVPERSVCIDVDPAGNTYEVTEAHCGLLDEVGSDA